MSSSRLWDRAAALFGQALERPDAERHPFVVQAAGDDPALRDRVLAMLRRDAQAAPLLDATPDALADAVTPETPRLEGRRIGPYVVRSVLGQGGMGVVCLAEREDVGKQVALKLVAGGLGSPERVKRFLRERRVLARLEHPNIAPLLDAGVADDGTPWFAMEYVDGEPVDRFCDRMHLTLDRRLELFERICAAVGYAHQNLVVHRDIKPANILVGQDGEPRLVDFGIAKLLAASDTGEGQETGTEVRLMTPVYASPEQIRGEPITTASDVYQLGALLFALLTGRHPHPERTPRSPVLPTDPIPRPSQVAPSVAGLSGDLDVIVLKATDLDAGRRYPTAALLQLDINRHRQGLPIEARPATAAYRLGKLVTRHRVGALVVATGLFTLMGFAGAMAIQNRRIEAQRVRAEQVSLLLTDLFAGANPNVTQGDSVTVQSILDRGLERLRADAGLDREVKARLLRVIGSAYFNLGQLTRSIDVQTEVMALFRETLPPTDSIRLESLMRLSSLLADADAGQRAVLSAEEALRVARTLPAARRFELAQALSALGYAHQRSGNEAAARPLLDEAVAVYRTFPDGGNELDVALVNLGFLATHRGDVELATTYFREVLDRRRSRLGPDHFLTARAVLHLATVLRGNDLGEAETLVREAVALHRRIFPSPNHDRLDGLAGLAGVLAARGKLAEAETVQREAVDMARTLFGDSSSAVALGVANLARYVQNQNRLAEAAQLHTDAWHRYRALLGDGHASTATTMTNLAYTEFLRGRGAEAEALYRRALPVLDSVWRGSPQIASTLIDFGWVLRTRAQCGEAEVVLRRALGLIADRPRGTVDVIRAQRFLGGCLFDEQRYAAAESLLVTAHETLVAAFGNQNRYALDAAADLARLYRAWGRPADAARFEPPPRPTANRQP